MSTTLLFAMLGAAGLALVLKRPRSALAFLALNVATTSVMLSGWPAATLLDRLQTAASPARVGWQKRNVIVLLGWDIVRWPTGAVTTGVLGSARVLETARRYAECKAEADVCVVLISGGDPLRRGRPEAEAMGEALARLGVPATDQLLENRSHNTFKNAEFSSALIRARAFDQVVLVTSGFHLTRSLVYFGHFLQMPVVGVPADHLAPDARVVPRTLNLAWLDVALTEIAGLIRFDVYNRLGWNPPAVK